MFLTTEQLDPNRKNITEAIDQNLRSILPVGYIRFLQTYGTGTYCDEIYVHYPDSENIPATFRDHTDLWELNATFTAEDLLQSVQLASTANGDIIAVTADRPGKIFILPRHAQNVISIENFQQTLDFFVPWNAEKYYDPNYDQDKEHLSLVKSTGGLIDISVIHSLFLRNFSFDFVVNETTQPKYFFKSFGGWVAFDLIYKNSIQAKFQKTYADGVKPLLNFLNELIG